MRCGAFSESRLRSSKSQPKVTPLGIQHRPAALALQSCQLDDCRQHTDQADRKDNVLIKLKIRKAQLVLGNCVAYNICQGRIGSRRVRTRSITVVMHCKRRELQAQTSREIAWGKSRLQLPAKRTDRRRISMHNVRLRAGTNIRFGLLSGTFLFVATLVVGILCVAPLHKPCQFGPRPRCSFC